MKGKEQTKGGVRDKCKGRELLDVFNEAAQDWVWHSVQGVGTGVGRSKVLYLEAYDKLLEYIEKLESNKIKIKRMKHYKPVTAVKTNTVWKIKDNPETKNILSPKDKGFFDGLKAEKKNIKYSEKEAKSFLDYQEKLKKEYQKEYFDKE